MMTCRELIDFLMAYLDGDLEHDVRSRFEEHLAECEECRAYLDSYRRVVALSGGINAATDEPVSSEVPEELVRSIRRALSKRGQV